MGKSLVQNATHTERGQIDAVANESGPNSNTQSQDAELSRGREKQVKTAQLIRTVLDNGVHLWAKRRATPALGSSRPLYNPPPTPASSTT